MTPPELRDLLADSLTLWGVAGARVAVDGDGVAFAGADGAPLRVRPAGAADRPVRWWIEHGGRRRPCTGTLGLLRGLRNAVGAAEDDPRRLRAAPPPP